MINDQHQEIFTLVANERVRQDAKFGAATGRGHTFTDWFTILSEEVGEVAQECIAIDLENADRYQELEEELIQVAALAVAMIEIVRDATGETHG